MSLFILDTDTLSLYQHGHVQVCQQISRRQPLDVVITVITVQEQLDGWRNLLSRARIRPQVALAYEFLPRMLVPVLQRFSVVPFPETAIARYEQLLTLRLNVGRMDLRIAAIALDKNAIVVMRNWRDFGRIPGLTLEDWSV